MNLWNFEEALDARILERGRRYYQAGAVTELSRAGDDWAAVVEGSESYDVRAALSEDGTVLETACDCPYEFGPYCKHEAALLLAIRAALSRPADTEGKCVPRVRIKEPLSHLLAKADRGEIEAFVLDYARGDSRFEELLRLRLEKPEGENMFDGAKRLIRESIRAASSHGFVEYGYAYAAAEGARHVLGQAEEMDDPLAAARLCVLAVEEMVELLSRCDDSNGKVGAVAARGTGLLSEIAKQAREQDQLFDIIFSSAKESDYDGWDDMRFELLEICEELCENPASRAALEEYLRSLTDAGEEDGSGGRYAHRRAERLTHRIIGRYDGEAAAEAYILSHLDNSDFREAAIEAALTRKDYARAAGLCLDGEAADAQYAGLAARWRQLRFRACEGMGDTDGLRSLAKRFVEEGEIESLKTLRALYDLAEWPAVRDALLTGMKRSRHATSAYEAVIVEEGLHERILALGLAEPYRLPRLYPYLPPPMRAQIAKPFANLIRADVERASSRGAYGEIMGLLRHYARALGIPEAEALRGELLRVYPRRRAMAEELAGALG